MWHVARVAEPRREPRAIGTLLVQTAILFASLLGFLYWQLRRITLPLARLTGRVEHIGAPGRGSEPMPESGPEDVARLIRAYNAAEARIGRAADEKDVMLGAIGHDLKTPLAALRVRIEIVEDATERARMVRGVEKITTTLDDILTLARLGRAAHPPERTDLSALAASVMSEYEDLGEAVRLMDDQRIVATVHAGWVQRALRNLIDNALRHGGGAARMSVSLTRDRGEAVLAVEDGGPGIPPGTGHRDVRTVPARGGEPQPGDRGAGLGLTIARSIAEHHGGALSLVNRPDGGLRAELRLPLTSAP